MTKFLFIIILIVLHQFIIKIVNENQDKIKGKEESKSFTKKKEINFNKVYFWNTTLLKNEMHTYSLYNIFKLTRISLILIDDINLRLKEFDTIYQIINICNLNLTNIEIIFVVQNENENDFTLKDCDKEK